MTSYQISTGQAIDTKSRLRSARKLDQLLMTEIDHAPADAPHLLIALKDRLRSAGKYGKIGNSKIPTPAVQEIGPSSRKEVTLQDGISLLIAESDAPTYCPQPAQIPTLGSSWEGQHRILNHFLVYVPDPQPRDLHRVAYPGLSGTEWMDEPRATWKNRQRRVADNSISARKKVSKMVSKSRNF